MIQLPENLDGVIEDRAYYLWRGDDGIVRVVYKKDERLSLDELKLLLKRIYELAGDQKAFVISDFSRMNRFGVDLETRRYATGPDAAQWLEAVAIVGQTRVSRMLANLLVYMTHPAFPMRAFAAEADAIEWLQTQRSSNSS